MFSCKQYSVGKEAREALYLCIHIRLVLEEIGHYFVVAIFRAQNFHGTHEWGHTRFGLIRFCRVRHRNVQSGHVSTVYKMD